jgi:hypothetical protein
MENFNRRAFNKPQLDQPPLDFDRRQSVIVDVNPNGANSALNPTRTEPSACRGQSVAYHDW